MWNAPPLLELRSGLTRRKYALFWDRPRVVSHRVYFSILRLGGITHTRSLSCAKRLGDEGVLMVCLPSGCLKEVLPGSGGGVGTVPPLLQLRQELGQQRVCPSWIKLSTAQAWGAFLTGRQATSVNFEHKGKPPAELGQQRVFPSWIKRSRFR